MMFLIHGEDSAKSREYLTTLRHDFEARGYQIYALSSGKITKLDLENLGLGQSLFEEKKLVIVEDFFSEKKSKDLIWPEGIDTIFYESTKISPLPPKYKLDVKSFDFEPFVFKFLDALAPKNQKAFMPLFTKYIHSTVPELAFTMIVRQFRFMILSLSENGEVPDDFSRLAPWQVAKIKKQAYKFGQENLISGYEVLLKIDDDAKTGKSEISLLSRLELFLLTL